MRGVTQIVRLNWPFYAGACGLSTLGLVAIAAAPVGAPARGVLYAALGAALIGIGNSLVASWLVYDRSPLMRWDWIPGALGFHPSSWINVHAGLDESTPALRRLMPASRGRVFDIFDPREMTESSIHRARRLARLEETPEAVDYRHLPAPAASVEAVLLLLSAHELRTHDARRALLGEVRRILAPGGRVVLAEHLRDVPNLCAFGPGFLHFHSRRSWRRCFAGAGLAVDREFAITPFVRVFVLGRTDER